MPKFAAYQENNADVASHSRAAAVLPQVIQRHFAGFGGRPNRYIVASARAMSNRRMGQRSIRKAWCTVDFQAETADEDRQHNNRSQRKEEEDEAEQGKSKRYRVQAEEFALFLLIINDIERIEHRFHA